MEQQYLENQFYIHETHGPPDPSFKIKLWLEMELSLGDNLENVLQIPFFDRPPLGHIQCLLNG